MRRVPITEPAAGNPAFPLIEAGLSEYDDVLGVYTIFLDIPRAETVYVRLVVESWEDFAVPRTVERFTPGDPGRSLVVMLTVPDFLEPAVRGLARLCAEVGGFQVRSREDLRESLRRDLLGGS